MVIVAHPWGNVTTELEEWVRTGPGPRPYVGIIGRFAGRPVRKLRSARSHFSITTALSPGGCSAVENCRLHGARPQSRSRDIRWSRTPSLGFGGRALGELGRKAHRRALEVMCQAPQAQ